MNLPELKLLKACASALLLVINMAEAGNADGAEATRALELVAENMKTLCDARPAIPAVTKTSSEDGLTPTEEDNHQMLINMPGVSINSKPRKDGRFQGYILKEDKKYYVYGKDRDEVLFKLEYILKTDMTQQRKKAKKSRAPILSDWLDKWMELYKKPNLKPNSYVLIQNVLKNLREKFGGRKMDSITTDELQAFFIGMTAERTRDLCLHYLSQAYRKALQQGVVKKDPCEALEIKKHVMEKRHALTLPQQREFLLAIRGQRYEPLCVLLLQTGMRVGEALALTPRDIDREKQTVFVCKNVVFPDGKRTVQNSPKTDAGVRHIPIPPEAFRLLPERKKPDEPLFPFTYNAVRIFLGKLSKSLGFTVTAHILRHTYATRLEEAGISPKMAQYLMGHASLTMTKGTYTDVQEEYVASVSAKLKTLFDT